MYSISIFTERVSLLFHTVLRLYLKDAFFRETSNREHLNHLDPVVVVTQLCLVEGILWQVPPGPCAVDASLEEHGISGHRSSALPGLGNIN